MTSDEQSWPFVIDELPLELQPQAEKVAKLLWQSLNTAQQHLLLNHIRKAPSLAQQLLTAIVGSEYLANACCREPELLLHWLLTDVAFVPITPIKIIDAINTACSDALTLVEFDRLLRRMRRRFMVGIYWRDLNNLSELKETTAAMTALAEVCIQQVVDFHYRALVEIHGQPIGLDSQAVQQMLVIGMGKLGGGELNVSSDIDLLFVFPESGQTDHANKSIDNQTFFNVLGQRVIKSLSEFTPDGFVFRVDMRLRPYGQSGALCSSFIALENYYESQGRDWERFAAIKARVVACVSLPDETYSLQRERLITDQFHSILHPFVYRKYIDFSMIESLRQLKNLIVQEVKRNNQQDDIKLGAGGIREIEFIVQVNQLIRGGRDPYLQHRNLIAVLQLLGEKNIIQQVVSQRLIQSYEFLRKLEHLIQAFNDQQSHNLPQAEADLTRLSWLLGFKTKQQFLEDLSEVRRFVGQEFQQVIAVNESAVATSVDGCDWVLAWQALENGFSRVAQNFVDANNIVHQLHVFKSSRHVLSLSVGARSKLDQLMPQLLCVIAASNEPDRAFALTLKWLDSIVNRTQYLDLLLENHHVLGTLIDLFLASRWALNALTQMPILLDELLYPEYLAAQPDKARLQDDLRQRFLRLNPDDEESAMETLRHFRVSHNFHVAVAELSGHLNLMQVSDYLSFTAEVVLEQVLQLAWQQLTARHGLPNDLGQTQQPKFLIVGYGKLGSLEMSYRSDLDLVFIYDADPQGETNGPRPLDNQTFYTRLGQKIIHQLNLRTLSGPLYEVDMRLRPSGNSGLLVSSISAFSRYQANDAWTWEHQALVRARPITGNAALAKAFINIRSSVLGQSRVLDILRKEVADMRLKMRVHSGSGRQKPQNIETDQQFHLKQDEGGVVDIEFMVQYAVLAYSHRYPAVCKWTDNVRIINSLQTHGLITDEQAQTLTEIYQTYRKISHRLTLEHCSPPIVDGAEFTQQRKQVQSLWNEMFI